MTVIEIVLLILGALIFAASFIIPEKISDRNSHRESGMGSAVNDIDAREMVETMKEDIERQVRLAVDTSAEAAVEDAVLRSERNIERVTNEKMMAIDEYAQTVMQDINKSHKEVVFLYDMLENKTVDIKNTVRKAESTRSEIEDAGKKVRSELEAIARRSAETVIANSTKPVAGRTSSAQAPEKESAHRQEAVTAEEPERIPIQEPERRTAETSAEPEILQQVTAIPAPAETPRTAGIDRAAEVQAVENSMKEKGVPKLGRALAAAFAQATMTNAAPEAQVSSVPAGEAETAQQQKQQYAGEDSFANEALSDLYAAVNPGSRAGSYGNPGLNVHEDNLHMVDEVPRAQEAFSGDEEEGDVSFSNTEDLQGLVISMHRQGIDDVEIAKRLSIGVGEVKLMIGLYGK